MKKGLPANIPTTSAICSATEPDISCFKVQCSLAPRQQGVVQFVRRDYLSEATSRRSRWGSVRGKPVLSSHFAPGFAPQVGQ